MIANDVVDLDTAVKESNWQRTGFIDKVFSSRETGYIFDYYDPELMVWLLWSMKESAYKISARQNKHRILAPLSFQCIINSSGINAYKGMVVYGSSFYLTRSIIILNKIYTLSYTEKPDIQLLSYKRIIFSNTDYKTQHREIYKSIKKTALTLISSEANNIDIRKNTYGVPELFIDEVKSDIIISLSHHGNAGAYVLLQQNNKAAV